MKLVVALIIIAALAMMVIVFSINFAAPRGAAFDFTPRYVGTQAFWEGESPYSPRVTERIQIAMFGGVLPPDVDQQRFAYPAYTAVLLIPLLALPLPTAIGVWMALQWMAVAASVVVWLYLIGVRPRPFAFAGLLLLFVFAYRYTVNLYVVGQFTGTMLLCIAFGTLALDRRRDLAAGVLFALAANPPTVAGLIGLLIVVRFALARRYRPLVAWLLTLAILSLIAVLRIGFWLPDFIEGLFAYADYSFPVAAWQVLPSGVNVAFIAGALLIAGMAWVRGRSLRQPPAAIQVVSDSVLIALLLLPQTGNYLLVLLIPVLINALVLPRWWIVAVLIALSCWLWFALYEVNPRLEAIAMPVLVALIWIVVRRQYAPSTRSIGAATG